MGIGIRIFLGVAALTAAGPAAAQQAAQAPAVLVPGSTVSGALLPSDAQRGSGKHEDVFTFSGRRGERVELRLSSTDFDPFLTVRGPGGFSAFNDDGGAKGSSSLDSRLVLALPADGTYRIGVTSFQAGATGTYRLSAAVPAAGAAAYVPERADRLAIGSAVAGSLAASDERGESGALVDRFRFTGRRGQRVALEVASGDFDTVLVLRGPDGERIENDDTLSGARASTDSRIETALAEDGEYTVMVTSFRPGTAGKYRLSLQPSAGTARQAAVPAGPRVFAVMVGVSDYAGRVNDLAGTAADAERLSAALAKAGVLNPASVVLTDAAATRAGVEAAFSRVAEQAGPSDLFLFFFSGHGDQIEARGVPGELDGRSETIELRDGRLTDVELARLMGKVRSRLALVVVDSCFSGGLRNAVNRPGIMGIFSSEEDLTSVVAANLGSGGYLSHFLPAELTGEGDMDGDGMVTAGEVSTYLRRQFRRQGEIGALTQDRQQRNFQNLVIERGAVQVDDVVLRLGAAPAAVASR